MPRKTIYTPEVVKFILQKSPFYSYRSIAELIKKQFGLPATIAGVKGVMRRTPHEIKPKVYTSCKSFPDYIQDYIAFMCVYYTDFELSKNLSDLFDIKCTPDNIRQWRQRRHIKTGRTGGEIDRGVVVLVQRNGRCARGAEAHQLDAVLGVSRAVLAHEEHHANFGDLIRNRIHTFDKLRAEYKHFNICKIKAVFYFIT